MANEVQQPELSTNEQIALRREKLEELRAKGNAYPNNIKQEDFAADLMASYAEWSKEELETVLDVAKYLKMKFSLGEAHRILQDKTLFMMFFEQSTRTRNSTEAAMTHLVRHAHVLTPAKPPISHGEPPNPFASLIHTSCRLGIP